MLRFLLHLLPFFAAASCALGQVIFVAPANFGGRTGSGLFQLQNGAVASLSTGFPEHNFPSLSRDNRFVVFSSPDGVTAPLQVPPSSDIYVYDRATGTTRRIVDNNTIIFSPNEVDTATPVSAELSPNNQLLAYGVMITRRQGTANPRSTKELNIARASDGLILANPTALRGPVSDSLQAEFVGLSWDPGGNSFVTPSYIDTVSDNGTPIQLPAIVRFGRNADDSWSRTQILSGPRYYNNTFPPSAEIHMYPSISPSGAGLAYFVVFWPDVLGSSQGVISGVVLASSDGSNARLLTTFDQGVYPAGLNWSPDGTQLIVSVAPQANIGSGFLPSAVLAQATLRTVATADGTVAAVAGGAAGAFPSWRASPTFGSVDGVQLAVGRSADGQFFLRADGVDPDSTYLLRSSADLSNDSFGTPRAFSGAQLAEGITLSLPTETRFFQLTNP
jgi:hypothetical protein